MTKPELLDKLKACLNLDAETGHLEADKALLDFIDDPEIREAYEQLAKWYA